MSGCVEGPFAGTPCPCSRWPCLSLDQPGLLLWVAEGCLVVERQPPVPDRVPSLCFSYPLMSYWANPITWRRPDLMDGQFNSWWQKQKNNQVFLSCFVLHSPLFFLINWLYFLEQLRFTEKLNRDFPRSRSFPTGAHNLPCYQHLALCGTPATGDVRTSTHRYWESPQSPRGFALCVVRVEFARCATPRTATAAARTLVPPPSVLPVPPAPPSARPHCRPQWPLIAVVPPVLPVPHAISLISYSIQSLLSSFAYPKLSRFLPDFSRVNSSSFSLLNTVPLKRGAGACPLVPSLERISIVSSSWGLWATPQTPVCRCLRRHHFSARLATRPGAWLLAFTGRARPLC